MAEPASMRRAQSHEAADAGFVARLRAAAAGEGLPPVERWDPPSCGDVGLAIDVRGQWSAYGAPIGRPALARLFAQYLRRDADGSYWVVTPVEKSPVAVARWPLRAVDLDVAGEGEAQVLRFLTEWDDRIDAGADHPLAFGPDRFTGDDTPRVRVRGRLEAALTRPVHFALLDRAVRGPGGAWGLWSAGAFFALPVDAAEAGR